MPFPKPYQNDTMIDRSIMDYGDYAYETMGIGSRRSALMTTEMLGPNMIDHVGGMEDGDEKKSRRRRKRLKGNA